MKKITLGIILGLSVALGFSFKKIYELENRTAKVNTYDGIAVFMDSMPLSDYEIIGSVKIAKISSNNDYIEARNTLVKKAKETYPTGEAIVFYYEGSSHRYMANVITFKK